MALLALGFTSCKKDYKCTCSVAGVASASTTIKDTKKNAKSACEKNSTTVTSNGMSITSTCTID